MAATGAFAPHGCRRTWIGELLKATDLPTARQLAGQARAETTAPTTAGPRPAAGWAATLHVPYVPPRPA